MFILEDVIGIKTKKCSDILKYPYHLIIKKYSNKENKFLTCVHQCFSKSFLLMDNIIHAMKKSPGPII